MKTTLFTGAGASKAIGYPLTAELLPLIRQGLREGNLFAGLNDREFDRQCLATLEKGLKSLLPGIDRAADDELPLITDVLSLVEHAILVGDALPVGSLDDLRRLRDLLKQAIVCVLLRPGQTACSPGSPANVDKEGTLDALAKWLDADAREVGLVTTNYDIGLEGQLYRPGKLDPLERHLDLGFGWRDANGTGGRVTSRPAQPALRVYKLHGSLDLLRCPLCGHVYFNPSGIIIHQAFKKHLDDHNTCHCNASLRLEPHIVAPSLVRDIRDSNLLEIWRAALEWMRTSGRWVIVGYSLPPEDLAIRSLLVRAYAGARKKPEIVVVQRSPDHQARYRMLFPDCDYRSDGLEGFLKTDAA